MKNIPGDVSRPWRLRRGQSRQRHPTIRTRIIFSLRRTSPQPRTEGPDLSVHVPALRRYIAKRAAPGDVDDLVQDVLVRMHVRGQSDPIANIEGYLFQVASSVLTDRARRDSVRHRGAHLELTETFHPVEELTPERVLRGREDVDRLVEGLHFVREVFGS